METGSVMHGLSGVGASTHQDVLLEVVLRRPMFVSFALQVETIHYANAPIPVASVDVGNNGSIDLTTPALGGQNTRSITFEPPAGTHAVRFYANTEILPPTVASLEGSPSRTRGLGRRWQRAGGRALDWAPPAGTPCRSC